MRIRVGFSTTNNLPSKIIRWFVKSNISHTYIRLYDCCLGSFLVFHADWPGVIIINGDKFDNENIVIEEYEIEDVRLREALHKNLRHLGKKFDLWDLLSWGWFIILKRWVKRTIKNPIEDPKKMICVDWVLRILNGANINCPSVGSVNPVMLSDWFKLNYKKMGWKRFVKEGPGNNLFEKMKEFVLHTVMKE